MSKEHAHSTTSTPEERTAPNPHASALYGGEKPNRPEYLIETHHSRSHEALDNTPSIQALWEGLKQHGNEYIQLVPILFALNGCATLESGHGEHTERGLEMNSYEKLPPHIAESLSHKLGFTEAVADRCYLRFNPDTVTDQAIHIGQIHPPLALWNTPEYYQASASPEVKKFIDPFLRLLPHNQEAIKSILGAMSDNSTERLTIMPEGGTDLLVKEYESMRNELTRTKETIAALSIEALPEYWEQLKKTDGYHETTDYTTSKTVEYLLERLKSHSTTSTLPNHLAALYAELAHHPSRFNTEQWSWYVGGALDAFMNDNTTDMYPIEPVVPYTELLANVYANDSYTINPEEYLTLQTERDRHIMDNVHRSNGGVLVMGMQHGYPDILTCIPKLPEGMTYSSATQEIGALMNKK